ncbi:hypothetical protein ACFO8O_15845 [Hephaestia sp. GCM10023244]|uniref:hypothetical protein n=1 Tax=unclassified Hephaestia TaxID=2631281 RepID=UPI0020775728|nr:hypothetical protein [Hephaestia sp. MAHUQ-44]MCM8732434.1 hypothetical protein [Hephaestia sp. MAHUQ-44]
MADRVSVTITIGGMLRLCDRDHLVETIIGEGLSTEWNGLAFDATQIAVDAPLRLVAHDVAWGRLDALEAFCCDKALPFVRWSGGYGGEWSPERVVFTGTGEPASYIADENERIVIDRPTIDRLGSFQAILAYFDAADLAVPPLIVIP